MPLPGVLMSITATARGSIESILIDPLVSTSTLNPSSQSASMRTGVPACSSGSPPVISTISTPDSRAMEMTSATFIRRPPERAYSVSQ